jgi:hypothetical protein
MAEVIDTTNADEQLIDLCTRLADAGKEGPRCLTGWHRSTKTG